MKIGLLGVSIFVASGDAGTTGELLASSSTSTVGQSSSTIPFQAGYPASSPYITCVGATEFANPTFNLANPPPVCADTRLGECATGGDEQSVSYAIAGYTAGGGFSDVDARPAYQADVVAGYLSSGVALPLNRSWFNATSRGLPDVTCLGYDAFVVNAGRWALESGTSQSTPIFAGIIAVLQAEYLNITNTTLGFINPLMSDQHTSHTHHTPTHTAPATYPLPDAHCVAPSPFRWLQLQGAGCWQGSVQGHHRG